MIVNWKHSEGTGWVELKGSGGINRRRDNVASGWTYSTAMTDQGGYALACGKHVGCGPETWFFESHKPLLLSDSSGKTASKPSLYP